MGDNTKFEFKAFFDDLNQLITVLGDTDIRIMVPDAHAKQMFD